MEKLMMDSKSIANPKMKDIKRNLKRLMNHNQFFMTLVTIETIITIVTIVTIGKGI